eukprot:1149438-Pelagomonas_calceolata.AAC.1
MVLGGATGAESGAGEKGCVVAVLGVEVRDRVVLVTVSWERVTSTLIWGCKSTSRREDVGAWGQDTGDELRWPQFPGSA